MSPVAVNESPTTAATSAAALPKRTRGKKPMLAMSFRITPRDWERLHLLAMAEGVSINKLTLRGLSKLFEARGLPGLDADG